MAFKVENWSKRSWQLGQKGEPYLVVWLRGFKPCSDNKPQPLLRNWVEASCGVSWQKGCCGGLFGGGRPRHRRNLKTFSEAVLSFLLGWSRLLRLLFFPVLFFSGLLLRERPSVVYYDDGTFGLFFILPIINYGLVYTCLIFSTIDLQMRIYCLFAILEEW